MSNKIQVDPLAFALMENKLLAVLVTVGDEIEDANKQFLTLSGRQKEHLSGLSMSEIFSVFGNEFESVNELLLASDKDIVYALLNRVGASPVMVRLSSSRYEVHGVIKRAIVMNDSDTVLASEDLKRQFMRKVSSDLRSPLSSLNGSLALIRSERLAKLPDSLKNVITIAVRNCNRLTLMINDILERERLESGKITVQRRKLDLAKTIEHAVKLVSGYSFDAGVTIASKCDPDSVFGDDERLTQVVAVLLRSAIIASPRDSQVDLVSKVSNDMCVVTFRHTMRDDSWSVSEADELEIDADFTSLSLDLCKEVMRLHDGDFRHLPKDGDKAGYLIELPLAKED